ncbi:Glycerophosphoryl diester phosphodiesterase [Granulibacter bethesdensis]|nr:Glycerophosphoryl diester phosphodiesterase [Granulibacter bethesdensis]
MVHWRRFLRVPMLTISVGVSGCTPTPTRMPWPLMIAHRGGTGDAPENTIAAIRQAMAHRVDAIWLTVQLSRDGIPVLYRPADLSALTDGAGKTAAFTAADLSRINAGWQFRRGDSYPWRDHPVGIPTLREALRAIPSDMPIILDMKALPAAPQTRAVAWVLEEEQAWGRVTIYATDAAYQQSFAAYPQARLFESRDATRARLLGVQLDQRCDHPPPAHARVAFELHRSLIVVEHFTLGEGRSTVQATMWTPATIACFRRHPDVKIVAIAVDNADDDRLAACLGVDAILTDSPQHMVALRQQEPAGPRCDRISHER